jgi:NAD(P)-dependent dehydrogenase (short-subunit alcohol dehydrogenase family)
MDRPMVLITGANRGIGLAFVEAHLEAGFTVFAGCRRPEQASDLQHLTSAYADQLTVVQLDVTDEGTIQAAAELLGRVAPRLDRLVNNAAVFHTTPLDAITVEETLQTFAVNSLGPVLVFRAVLPLLRVAPRPIVVNISSNRGSVSGQVDTKLWDYAASKAALNSYTRKMAFTLEPDNGLAVAIDPGWVQTRMGGDEAALTPAATVAGMMHVIETLTPEQNGAFLQWDGAHAPW